MLGLNSLSADDDHDSKFIDSIFTLSKVALRGSRIFTMVFVISYHVVVYQWATPFELTFWASLLL